MSERAYQADTTGADGRQPGTKKDPSAAHAPDAGASCAAGAAIRPGRTAGWEADAGEASELVERDATGELVEAAVNILRLRAKCWPPMTDEDRGRIERAMARA